MARIQKSGGATALLRSMTVVLALAVAAIGCGGDEDPNDGPGGSVGIGGSGGGDGVGGSGGDESGGGSGGSHTEHPLCDADPTWDDFAQPFVQQHCLSCHSSALTGAARSRAPVGVDFDTEDGLRKHGTKAVSQVRAGKMPKGKGKLDPCYADQLEAFLDNG